MTCKFIVQSDEGTAYCRLAEDCVKERDARIIVIQKERDELIQLLTKLTKHDHVNLDDLVYQVREREGLGWDGPAVTSWGALVQQVNQIVADAAVTKTKADL